MGLDVFSQPSEWFYSALDFENHWVRQKGFVFCFYTSFYSPVSLYTHLVVLKLHNCLSVFLYMIRRYILCRIPLNMWFMGVTSEMFIKLLELKSFRDGGKRHKKDRPIFQSAGIHTHPSRTPSQSLLLRSDKSSKGNFLIWKKLISHFFVWMLVLKLGMLFFHSKSTRKVIILHSKGIHPSQMPCWYSRVWQ